MDMQLVSRDMSTPNGCAGDDAFSMADDLESCSQTPVENPFSKYSDDPPALIACVAFLSDSAPAMANPLVQCHGGYWERENDGKEDSLFSPVSSTLTNTTKSREGPQVLHIQDPRI